MLDRLQSHLDELVKGDFAPRRDFHGGWRPSPGIEEPVDYT